jgi:hypothetical protein
MIFSLLPDLERVDRRLMLCTAHNHCRSKFKGRTLWGFVSEMCGVGSTTAKTICKECGWDPDQECSKATLSFP